MREPALSPKADTTTPLYPGQQYRLVIDLLVKTSNAEASTALLSLDSQFYVRPIESASGHEGIEVVSNG